MSRMPAYFAVRQPMIAPVRARPGEWLALWIGHPEHTVLVISRDRQRVLFRGNLPLALTAEQLLTLCKQDVISGLSPSDEALLLRVA